MATPLDETLAEAKSTAKEQIAAAAQLQAERLVEQISSVWRGQIEHVFEERLADLSSRIEAQARAAGQRDATRHLNQAVRRLRLYESEEQWSRALVDATEGFCDRAAFFVVNQQNLEARAARGLASLPQVKTPIRSAPAFASAIETRDTVVALRTRGELSDGIARVTGEAPDKRFHLFPIASRDRVAAVLYADADHGKLDTNALELLTAIGGAVIEGLAPTKLHSISKPKDWIRLDRQEQDLHQRAQRFARVQVAEMRLQQSQAVKDGRMRHDIYGELKPHIDAARQAFQRDFVSASDTMVDYLHLELVRTLAVDDAELLGPAYPGPLV